MGTHRFITFIVILIFLGWTTGCTSSDDKKGSDQENFILKYDLDFQDYNLAVGHYNSAVAEAKSLDDDELLLWSFNRLTEGLRSADSIESAFDAHERASKLLDGMKNLKYVADYYIISGNLLNYSADYDSSITQYKIAEEILLNMEDEKKRLADVYIGLGLNSRYQNDYDSYAENTYRALQLSEEIGDSASIYGAKEELGILNYYQGDYEKAIVIYKSSLHYHERENNLRELSFAHTVLGLCHTKLKQFDRAIFHAQKSYDLRISLGDERGVGESLNNLAFIQMYLKNWTEAITLLKESYIFLERAGDIRQLPIIVQNISDCFYYMEQLDSAKVYNDESLQLARKNGMKTVVQDSYKNKSRVFVKEGNYKEALSWYQKYTMLHDSIFNSEKTSTIEELKLQYESDKHEQDLLIARKESRIKSYQIQLIIGVGCIILVLVIAFFVIKTVRFKRDKIVEAKEREVLNAKVESAAKILQLKDEELKSLASQITMKNNLISETQEEMSKSTTMNTTELRKIKLLTEEDWVNFKEKFEEIHPDLLRKIQNQGFKLSFSDKRYIMLLKLGLSTDEISRTLGISISSVRTHKYRLKKKLPKGEEVEDLIR